MQSLLNYYKDRIISMSGHEYLDNQYTINNFFHPLDDMSDDEIKYRRWGLKINYHNLFNDVFGLIEVGL